ncbi:MAG: hypothetical protein C4536_00730 [Actinobacteria bacterium]|nr:MAG: hypothetical protein C4536_00730 [Actinomycetota bacterium]
MKKAWWLLVLVIITTSLVVAVPGCGQSSEDLAAQYIGRGDRYAYRMASEGETMSAALEDFFAILQGPNPEAIINPGGPLDQYEAAQGEMSSSALQAEAEYQGVLTLSGVEEEKEYATMMIEVAGKTAELAEFVDEWFNKALDVIETMDESKIRSYLTGDEFEGGMVELEGMRAEIDAVAAEASDYRLERDF